MEKRMKNLQQRNKLCCVMSFNSYKENDLEPIFSVSTSSESEDIYLIVLKLFFYHVVFKVFSDFVIFLFILFLKV